MKQGKLHKREMKRETMAELKKKKKDKEKK